MSVEETRLRIIELIRKMREQSVTKGCTPAEAAHFAAKAAEWIEKYQIAEAELRAKDGSAQPEVEVTQNFVRTDKRVFNPGMTQVVNALAQGMCCKCVLLHKNNDGGFAEAVYGIIGDVIDADYVCQIATSVVPALQTMALLEGREHGYEKAGLIRWSNQYLTGAAGEIKKRIEAERKERSEIKELEHRLAARVTTGAPNATALACITGETLALRKREVVEEAFRAEYPRCKTTHSKSGYDHAAHSAGREAGKKVGLRIAMEGK